MQRTLLAFSACLALALGASNQDTPMSKVTDLLTDLQAKITAEGEASAKAQEESAAMCKDRSKDLGFAIQTSEAAIEELKAKIEEATATITNMEQKVDNLGAGIAQNTADVTAATSIRTKEATDFGAEEKELGEIIDTLERAIGLLQKEMQKSSSAFLQDLSAEPVVQALDSMLKGSVLSTADSARLTALIQNGKAGDDMEDVALGAPDAAVYEGQSHGIIDTLEDLLDKAQEQLSDARKAETTAAHNFNMLEQSLKDETKYMESDMAAAKKTKATSSGEKAEAEGDLAVTSKTLSADQASLAALNQSCAQSQEDFDAEVASRAEELSAVAEALKVLGEMTGNATSLSYGLSQVTLLQRTRSTAGMSLVSTKVVRLLRDLAKKEHTPELAQLASRVASLMQQSGNAGEDPFAKVKGLISDLITKLEEEASAEASAKAFCDEELAESNAKKEEKTDEIAKLTSSIDSMTAKSAKLKEETAALQKSLSELASTQAEMDALRKEEHETYVQSKADMEMGLQGVSLAVKALREYYGKEDKAHEATEGSATGIIGMLEVIESDFSKDLATIGTTEASALSSYESTTQQNKIEQVTKEQDVTYKAKESVSLDKASAEASSDRANVQAELDAISEYLAQLEEQCTVKAMSYEERKKRREDEIAGLKQALEVLESETSLIQQHAHHAQRPLTLNARRHRN